MGNGAIKNKIEADDVSCPITLEVFQDPVIAKDGQTYERQAITRWIQNKGTSPFTRQQLQINDLQPDQRLRHLAQQYQNQQENNSTHIPMDSCLNLENRLRMRTITNGLITTISLFSFPIILILGIILGINNSYLPAIYLYIKQNLYSETQYIILDSTRV